MTVRLSRRRKSSLAEVVDRLPERFLSVDFVVDPAMDGLRAYTADLQRHLSAELGVEVEQHVVFDVMAELGIPPSVWYAMGFEQSAKRQQLGFPTYHRS